MNCLKIALAGFAVIAAMCSVGSADAAEIKVLASGSLKGALSRQQLNTVRRVPSWGGFKRTMPRTS
jgi:ABC-type molybdate transport system substrate-binding protein